MDVDALMDAYVQDVVRLLPRKQRTDVALELRELVREELQSRAASLGRTLDRAIALEGLRAFGRPQDVAARYFEPWVIIPPTETRRFMFAAIIGTLVLIALSPLNHEPSLARQLGLAILAWLGVLVAYFGIQSFRHRQGNATSSWVPRGSDHVSRLGSIALIVLILVGIVAYGAPGWLFSQITHGLTLTAWLDYDPVFRSSRLPVLFFLWLCQAALFAVLAMRGRWNPTLRRVDVCLETGVVLILVWFLVAGNVFKEAVPNKTALSLISATILILLIDVGVKLYRGGTRSLSAGT
ncbi:MAG TPA: hypothetical protein VGC19_07020 [Rhodanobacter sp.]